MTIEEFVVNKTLKFGGTLFRNLMRQYRAELNCRCNDYP